MFSSAKYIGRKYALVEGFSLLGCRKVTIRYLNMKAWQFFNYGDSKDLTLTTTATLPIMRSCSDILVQVKASSINPLDVAMLGGYGNSAIGALRTVSDLIYNKKNAQFPLTLGRDFSGIVVDCGRSARNFKRGDEVWGVVPFNSPGSHADYVIAPQFCVALKPKNLSFAESAAVPYVCNTAVSTFQQINPLKSLDLQNKRVLILGGSGGVGTFIVQWLKTQGAFVATTVSSDAIELVQKLGADLAIDYKDEDMLAIFYELEPFDVILNAIGHSSPSISEEMKSILLPKRGGCLLTLSSPFLKNMDDNGIVLGGIKSVMKLGVKKMISYRDGYDFQWTFVNPLKAADILNSVRSLYESKMIVPVIDKVFEFDDLPEAFETVAEGHARGKVVIKSNSK